ncbi:unnamed protein product [Linum tenue]|uniref:Uncharacterized protein n=1 Tax=Linum tenue TaxID=586396 RepID=A0AAV0M9G3_9ROSI|nr:unnamed protein product [Linum tenue]
MAPSNNLFLVATNNAMLLSFFVLVLSTNVLVGAAGRPLLESPAGNKSSVTYAAFKPPADVGPTTMFHGGREVNDCLPKGFHRNSAPSRYINLEPLGTSSSSTIMCETEKH